MKRLWALAFLALPVAVFFVYEPARIVLRRLWVGPDDYPYSRYLGWFLRNQNPDGSWGESVGVLEGHAIGRPGMTGLALLTLLGEGHSHLSKDRIEGRTTGDAARRGLQWLMRDQLPGGTFGSSNGVVDHAVATLALVEAYGLTGSNLFKNQAQNAVDALIRLQENAQAFDDVAAQGWALMALKAAEISGLSFPRVGYDRIRSYFDARLGEPPGAHEVMSRIFTDKSTEHPRLSIATDRLLAQKPDWSEQDFASWHWSTLAIFQRDGPNGPKWRAWVPFMHTLARHQGRWGDWPGRNRNETVIRTSLAAQTLQVYFRYANTSPNLYPPGHE